jgi:hypothetical protein
MIALPVLYTSPSLAYRNQANIPSLRALFSPAPLDSEWSSPSLPLNLLLFGFSKVRRFSLCCLISVIARSNHRILIIGPSFSRLSL